LAPAEHWRIMILDEHPDAALDPPWLPAAAGAVTCGTGGAIQAG
jgi:hypothetical protein